MRHVSLHRLRAIKMLVVVCALSMLLLPATSAAGDQDFTLVNATDVEINAVYISPHSTNEWEEDILGQDRLASGENVEITFSRTEKAAKWDLRIEDKSGNAIEWENLNLLEISQVTLHYKDGKAWAEVE